MRRFIFGLAASGAMLGTGAAARGPSVAADIAPVHALVAQVMGDLDTPALVVRPGASPHGYAMRPSEAAALDRADLVIWMGPALTPWLEGAIGTLAAQAQVLELLDADGLTLHPFRTGTGFEPHDHDAPGDHVDHADHDKHDKHADDSPDAHQDHAHAGVDPHAWLDPVNAQVWLGVIAAELSALDPENAATYAANARAGRAALDDLQTELRATLAPMAGRDFVVFHDAYQYFEARFEVPSAGAIALGDAADPGPARIAELRDLVKARGIDCVFAEPQFDPRLVQAVFGGVVHHGVVDPLGTDLAPGPQLYPDLLRGMAGAFAACADD